MAFMPLCGFAAGLGKLNVNSGLGEPLKAEVELLSVTPEELSTLVAVIASEEAYAVQGITRLGIHNNIKVDLAKNADGSPVLKLRSNQPISDPYLDMLIQVDWASGRLLREYTVLLDPPGYKESINSTPAPIVSLPSTTSKQSKGAAASDVNSSAFDGAPQNFKKSKKSKKISNQTTEPQDQGEVGASTDGGQLITTPGDTLNSIAKEMQVEGVSLDQMLVGLFENNKEAFSKGNMNRLKVGQIIKAPSKEKLTAIDAQQARQAIKVHSANWNEYRSALAGTVAEKPAAEEAEKKQSASGKIATAEDQAAPVKAGTQDVVKLSAGEKDTGKGGKDFDAKILALQEEVTAREKALKESQGRTAALEKQIEDMQKLLALKNQTMTDLQKNAENSVPAATPAEAKIADNQPAPTVEVKKTPPVVKAPVEVPPVAEPSFIEGLLTDVDITLVGGAAGITLLGAGWLFLRNKRRKDLDSFERGILTSGGLRANTVFGNTTGSASTSDTSFLTDFAQSADGSMIDTNDVDPIAEAEVYMAYGRDAQAEEILKDAILKEPKRYELHLKLLEMYAGRKDASAFETIAGELYTTLGADDPTWAKVAELGVTVEPENPLYDISKVVSSSALTSEKLDVSDFADAAVSTEDGLDFSFDEEPADAGEPAVDDANSVVMQSFASAENVEQDKSFDLGTVVDDDSSNDFTDTSSLDADLATNDLLGSNSIELGLPETNSAESMSAAIDSPLANAEGHALSLDQNTDNSMDFDLSDFNVKKEAPAEAATVDSTDDLPVFEFANTTDGDQVADLDLAVVAEKPVDIIGDVEFGLEFDLPNATSEAVQTSTVEEISFDLPSTDDNASTVKAKNETLATEFDANEFDFSAISLDLGEDDVKADAEQVSNDVSVELTSSAASENQDVDIKLDLVAAYIDMDDKEGARELLDEVIKEGGPQQKQRAEQLLVSLA